MYGPDRGCYGERMRDTGISNGRGESTIRQLAALLLSAAEEADSDPQSGVGGATVPAHARRKTSTKKP